jgi:hypothetical protein
MQSAEKDGAVPSRAPGSLGRSPADADRTEGPSALRQGCAVTTIALGRQKPALPVRQEASHAVA